MEPTTVFREMLDGVIKGTSDAERAFFNAYYQRLVRLANRRLNGPVRRVEDPDDIASSTLKSFCRRMLKDKNISPEQLLNEDALWKLLATIAARKCIQRYWTATARKRDMSRDQSIAAMLADKDFVLEDEKHSLREETEKLFESAYECLPTDRHRLVVRLLLEGYTQREVAAQIDRDEKSVRNMLTDDIRPHLALLLADDDRLPADLSN